MNASHRITLIEAAITCCAYEARVLDRGTIDTDSLRFDLSDKRRAFDALDQIEHDYRIDVTLPLELMGMLHGSAESEAESPRLAA